MKELVPQWANVKKELDRRPAHEPEGDEARGLRAAKKFYKVHTGSLEFVVKKILGKGDNGVWSKKADDAYHWSNATIHWHSKSTNEQDQSQPPDKKLVSGWSVEKWADNLEQWWLLRQLYDDSLGGSAGATRLPN